jgi:hypothetical protein
MNSGVSTSKRLSLVVATGTLNFIKTLLLTIDKDTYERLMASEAIGRFVSSSFWALLICSSLLLVDIGMLFAFKGGEGFRLCMVLCVVYLILLYGIVRHFRFMRCKEVEMVFNASFADKEEIPA